MVNQLQRLGLPPNASLEQKRLALDLAAVIISWEQRRRATSTPIAPPPLVRPRNRPRHEALNPELL